MLAADSYLYQKFSNDPFMQKTVLDDAKLLTPVITSQSITDYRLAIFNLMTSFVQDDLYYQQLALAVSLANLLIFLLPALRMLSRLRQAEEYALEKRCEGTFYLRKASEILDFMRQITLEEVSVDKLSEEMHIYDTLAKDEAEGSNNSKRSPTQTPCCSARPPSSRKALAGTS
jgi:hypothetical protein